MRTIWRMHFLFLFYFLLFSVSSATQICEDTQGSYSIIKCGVPGKNGEPGINGSKGDKGDRGEFMLLLFLNHY